MPDPAPDTGTVSVAKWISGASAATLLAIAVVAFTQGYVVSGTQYQAVVAERDEWKKIALEGLRTAESASKVRFSLPLSDDPTPGQVTERLNDVKDVVQ